MLPTLDSMAARLRLRHFRLLIAIDDHGSVQKAAEAVALTQPGATKALQEIESAMGEQLFIRNHRGLEPNELGHCVIRYARLVMTDMQHLREEMKGVLEGVGGRLSIGMIMGAVPLAMEGLSRLLQKQPQLSVQVHEDTSARLLHLIDDGRLDIAICRTSVSHRPEQYRTVKVKDEQLCIAVSVQHPCAKLSAVTLEDVADYPWVVCSANMPMRRLLEREFNEYGLQFPTNLVETTSAFATMSLMRHSHQMVALLSTDVGNFFSQSAAVRVLPVTLRTRSEPYMLVTRWDRTESPVMRMFIEQLVGADAVPEAQAGVAELVPA
ncbi:MAG: LysR family transcriptional regulator [Alphaproteobacteria bacterium]|nr:LysR family transcriptional regulator [Alphaproteobacteria bacterium]MBU1560237.1 LysR family transcriptional regulator [Alphaproteobacteria bacterium]MBU2303562.1 LysR family transcriptional regulator [Alphaproteobacteria bacterium]MBU2366161.1 LysR family transcriptional regulator [Alphaproteobacteria bacterium]